MAEGINQSELRSGDTTLDRSAAIIIDTDLPRLMRIFQDNLAKDTSVVFPVAWTNNFDDGKHYTSGLKVLLGTQKGEELGGIGSTLVIHDDTSFGLGIVVAYPSEQKLTRIKEGRAVSLEEWPAFLVKVGAEGIQAGEGRYFVSQAGREGELVFNTRVGNPGDRSWYYSFRDSFTGAVKPLDPERIKMGIMDAYNASLGRVHPLDTSVPITNKSAQPAKIINLADRRQEKNK